MVDSHVRQLDLFNTAPVWVPTAYQIRESKRAKHVSIRVSHLGEVEVVTPPGFDRAELAQIVEKRQSWIEKHLNRIEAERRSLEAPSPNRLPDQIQLRSLPEDWAIDYHSASQAKATLNMPSPGRLLLSSPSLAPDLCYSVLRQWLSRKAYYHFGPWLQNVSKETRLPFKTFAVRGQKTRWASCSNRKSISLNYKLLFLPSPLVRYVFIHELCHTVHMNHSAKFWSLVGQKEPAYRDLDLELRTAWRYVPEWVDR